MRVISLFTHVYYIRACLLRNFIQFVNYIFFGREQVLPTAQAWSKKEKFARKLSSPFSEIHQPAFLHWSEKYEIKQKVDCSWLTA